MLRARQPVRLVIVCALPWVGYSAEVGVLLCMRGTKPVLVVQGASRVGRRVFALSEYTPDHAKSKQLTDCCKVGQGSVGPP